MTTIKGWIGGPTKLLLAAVLVVGVWRLPDWYEARRLRLEVEQLEAEKRSLVERIKRLQASRRVAQVRVLQQYPDAAGRQVNLLEWIEIGPQGVVGSPVHLLALGRQVYFEGLVLKFAYPMVEQADPQRGASLVLFRRVFGDQQAAESVPDIEREPNHTLPAASQPIETELWARFWEFVDDPQLAKEYGVRIAQAEAPAVRLQTGQLWEITLDAAGGLNMRKIN
ncbi:MAG: hypothetical protein HJJLKODD_00063 [Phycisphaerae bacterium]|nr:hypothetical protein [Phycisphaerae bacterium]